MQEQKRGGWRKFLMVPRLLREVYLASACLTQSGFHEGELGDADIHVSVDAVQCGDNALVIRSPGSERGPENIISPKHQEGL